MIVVADISPLNYLIRIGAVDVLQPLYTDVLIPQTVAEELKKEKAPDVVKTWIARPPEWLEFDQTRILIHHLNSSTQVRRPPSLLRNRSALTRFSSMIWQAGQKLSGGT
jgi:hypothetical protein